MPVCLLFRVPANDHDNKDTAQVNKKYNKCAIYVKVGSSRPTHGFLSTHDLLPIPNCKCKTIFTCNKVKMN